MRGRWFVALTLFLAALELRATAHAQTNGLGRDIAQLREALANFGHVEQLKPRLLERQDLLPLVLPPWALDPQTSSCTTVVVLGVVPTQMVLHVAPAQNSGEGELVVASAGGVVQVSLCGEERIALVRAALEMRSPRGLLHTLVLASSELPPRVGALLPERDPGEVARPGDPGPPPSRAPIAERLARFESDQVAAGALGVQNTLVPEQGAFELTVEPGCYELLVASAEGTGDFSLVMREEPPGKLRTVDPSEAGDASASFCRAQSSSVVLGILAGPSSAERWLTLARYPLPARLPTRFGTGISARLAEALGGSQAPRALGPLAAASLGAQGPATLARKLLPSSCYLAALVIGQGEANALSLAVRTAAGDRQALSVGSAPGPRISFCTGANSDVAFELDARGLGVSYLFALFLLGPAELRVQ